MPVRKSRGAGGPGILGTDDAPDLNSQDKDKFVSPTALAKSIKIGIGERTDLELRSDWNGTVNGVFPDFNTFRTLTFTGEVPGRWAQYLEHVAIIIDWTAKILRPERTQSLNTYISEYNIAGKVTRKILYDDGSTKNTVVITYNKSVDLTADYALTFKDVVPPTADVKTLHYEIEITYSSGGTDRAHEYQTSIILSPAYVELSDHLEMEFSQRQEFARNGSDVVLFQDGLERGSVFLARELNEPNFLPVSQNARRYTSISKVTKHVHKKVDFGIPYQLESIYSDGIFVKPFLTGSNKPTLVIYKFHFVVRAGTAGFELKKDSHTLRSYTGSVIRGEHHFTDKEFEGDASGKYLDLSWYATNTGSTDITIDGFHSVEFLKHTGLEVTGQEELFNASIPLKNIINTSYANLTRPIYIDEFKEIIGLYHNDENSSGEPSFAGQFHLYPPLMGGEWNPAGTYTSKRTRVFGVAYSKIPIEQPWCRNLSSYFYQAWTCNPIYTSSHRKSRCTRFAFTTRKYSSRGGSFSQRHVKQLIGVYR